MNQLDRFKCINCLVIPDSEVFQCRNNHFVCEKCNKFLNGTCKSCHEGLSMKTENPILQELGLNRSSKTSLTDCKFKDNGCTWRFNVAGMEEHVKECKYRLFACIGKTLNVWQCQWMGLQSSLKEHIHQDHSDFEEAFSYFQDGCIPFQADTTSLTLKLVDAFNKQFVFFFHSKSDERVVNFLIFVLGRREDAEQYFYEFEIKQPKQLNTKIKFTSECHSDTENIPKLIDQEQGVSLSYNAVTKYLYEDNIHFRFIIKRKEEEKENKIKTCEKVPTATAVKEEVKAAKLAAPFVFAKKGFLKQSSYSKKVTMPLIAAAAVNKAVTVQKAAAASPTNTGNLSRQSSDPSEVRPRPPYQHTDSMSSDCSSINRTGIRSLEDPLDEAPCYQPSINKRDRKISDCSRTSVSCLIPSDQDHVSMSDDHVLKQPYKVRNHHGMYLQKYPESSISKPTLKK